MLTYAVTTAVLSYLSGGSHWLSLLCCMQDVWALCCCCVEWLCWDTAVHMGTRRTGATGCKSLEEQGM
jgi:hypothetical protein